MLALAADALPAATPSAVGLTPDPERQFRPFESNVMRRCRRLPSRSGRTRTSLSGESRLRHRSADPSCRKT